MKNPIKILIVEDEAMTAMYLKMVLGRAGFLVQKTVATGEDAVKSALSEAPDIIIMDIRLAGKLDGIEAAKKIKDENDIPIIFMTGYPDKTYKERAQQINPVEYFIKPINNKDLVSAIGSVFA